MNAIIAMIKVILYMFFMYIIVPALLTMTLLITRMFITIKNNVVLFDNGPLDHLAIETIFEDVFFGLRYDSLIIGITVLSGVIGLALIGLIFRMRRERFTKELKICKIKRTYILPLILVGIATNFVITVIINYIPYPKEWVTNFTSILLIDELWINILFTVVYTAIFKELFFRGLIYTRLKNGMNKHLAAFLSAGLFGLIHIALLQIIYATIMGLILVYVFEKFESVIPCIIIHIVNNFIGLIIASIDIEINFTLTVIYVIVMSVITIIATKWLFKKKLMII